MKNKILFCFTLMLLIAFQCYPVMAYFKLSRLRDSTILEIHSSKEKPITFYYNNIYLERPTVNKISVDTFFTIKTDFPILVVVSDSIYGRKTPYSIFHGDFTVNNFIIYPNENIKVWRDNNGFTRMKTNDSIRTNELNFFVDMEKELGLFEGFGADLMPLRLTAKEGLDKVNDLYNRRISFLENYQTNHKISLKFMKYVQNIFASRKLERLTSSYYSFYTSAFKKRDPLIDSKLEEWIRFDEDYYYIPEYRGTIQQYLHYLAIKNNKNTDLSNLIILADEQLKGNTKEIALFDLVLLAVRSGNVKTEDVFAKYMTYAPNGFLKEYVEKSFKSQILAKRLGVGNDILESELISNLDLKSHTWAEILNTDENKFIYLDFWASWCAPCRVEMPYSKQLSEEYASKGIKFIYVSTDDNITSWKKAIADLGLNTAIHFDLPDGKKSAFSEKFNIKTIPRYMLVGKDGKIINSDAPRPSDPKLRVLFDELLKNK